MCAYRMAENPAGHGPAEHQEEAGACADAPPQKTAKQLKKEAKKEAKMAKYNEKMAKGVGKPEVKPHPNNYTKLLTSY